MSDDISQLIAKLISDDVSQRIEAAEALSQLGDQAAPAAVPLVRAAGDEDEEVIEWATAALEELGAPATDDAAALSDLLDDKADVAYWAATLIGRLGSDAAGAVDRLATALSNHDALAVRERAAWALGKIGPAAAPALDELQRASETGSARLARLAKEAIQNIGGRP